ncbi:MAG: efflux RND transporter periplasmic adaptor subunit [wastewater metagenome]|nr:efflux RND transporter periplasmic adaptor subunit [Candidatus Loosdrechtia aerotolerans]
MQFLQSWKTPIINTMIIFFCIGIVPGTNSIADQKHQDCRGACEDAICPEHGIPEKDCSSCNLRTTNNNLTPDAGQEYERLLKRYCEHNVSVIECDNCRYEFGVVKVDGSVIGEAITIQNVGLLDIDVTLKATGEVGPNRDRFVIASPRIPGVVKEVYVDWGNYVKKGQKLALLDSIELGETLAEYMKVKAELDLARKNYSREKSLYEQNISSRKHFLKAENTQKQAQIALQALKEKLILMGLQEDDIEGRTEGAAASFFLLSAPFDGTIIEKNAAVGELKDAFAPVVTIADLSHLWVWFDIYEKDIPKIRKGNEVLISVASYPEEYFKGLITYVGATINERTRTVKVRAEVENHHEKLKPGMFAKVLIRLLSEIGNNAPVVPEETIQTDGQKHFVFVPLDSGYFIRRDIVPGARMNGYVKVTSGLRKNDRVVVKGSFLLKSEIMKEKFGEGCCAH